MRYSAPVYNKFQPCHYEMLDIKFQPLFTNSCVGVDSCEDKQKQVERRVRRAEVTFWSWGRAGRGVRIAI